VLILAELIKLSV